MRVSNGHPGRAHVSPSCSGSRIGPMGAALPVGPGGVHPAVTADEALQAWLESPDATNVEAALRRTGVAPADALHLLDAVTEAPTSTVAVRELRERCGIANRSLERWLLVRRGLEAVAALEQ